MLGSNMFVSFRNFYPMEGLKPNLFFQFVAKPRFDLLCFMPGYLNEKILVRMHRYRALSPFGADTSHAVPPFS